MKFIPLSFLLTVLMVSSHVIAKTEVPMQPEAWQGSENMRFMNYLSEDSVVLGGGPYVAGNSPAFKDGRIEVDVAMHGVRGFVGVTFRHQASGDYELIYLRPHKSGLPDAVQYTPALNGLTAWQLYSNEGFTAAADLAHGRWVHLAVEFSGDTARVYIDDRPEPALIVTDLKGDFGPGQVGLWGRNVAHFANFSFEASKPQKASKPSLVREKGVVYDWDISDVYEAAVQASHRIPDKITWSPAAPEADGLVNISRHKRKLDREVRSHPEQNRDVVYARTSLNIQQAGVYKLNFSYSDDIVVFLDRKPVCEGRSGFAARYPFSLGIVARENDAVFLDLEEGEHELMFAVSEVFGGWGFSAKLNPIES